MVYFILKLVVLLLSVLLSVAFLTLLERKILGYIQKRKGPNKLGAKGILQPFSDAIKLLSKETLILVSVNHLVFFLSPITILLVSLLIWLAFPSSLGSFELKLSIIFIMCCLSASVYPILSAGWASNSKFPFLGSLRAVAQTISYEVSFAFIILSLVALTSSYSLNEFMIFLDWMVLLIFPPLAVLWFTSALAETNRTPFDFSEGESELVSGFNTEYSASGFVLFFLAEYSSILFMSMLTSILFFNSYDLTFSLTLSTLFIAYIFIWVRGTLPRLRYDKLMALAWKIFLPVAISYLLFIFSAAAGVG
uniref:NADH-ubiquinone oxidoreductase chain 1 n=1 Tax=Cylisticus convexus TaxID=96835 RepID=A0A0G2T4U4_9CRUS|nr:NADH dehydrogenase subunit 1 [Cylisticus convexus]